MSYISLPFGLVRKEKKSDFIYKKNYGASQYINRLPYIKNGNPNFQKSDIDIVNN